MIQRISWLSPGAQKETYFYMLVFISRTYQCPSSFVTEILTGRCVCYSCMHKAQTLITKTGSHMLKILSGSCFLQAGKCSSELSPCPQLNRSAWRGCTGEIMVCSQRRVEYLNVPSSLDSGCYCFQGLIFPTF